MNIQVNCNIWGTEFTNTSDSDSSFSLFPHSFLRSFNINFPFYSLKFYLILLFLLLLLFFFFVMWLFLLCGVSVFSLPLSVWSSPFVFSSFSPLFFSLSHSYFHLFLFLFLTHIKNGGGERMGQKKIVHNYIYQWLSTL